MLESVKRRGSFHDSCQQGVTVRYFQRTLPERIGSALGKRQVLGMQEGSVDIILHLKEWDDVNQDHVE